VVPTFNRPVLLERCLSALALQDYPPNAYEVIVADDGGSCDVEALVQPFAGKMKVKVVRQDNRGPACARNLGAAAATGHFLAFTDDDCQPAPAWLGAMEAELTARPDGLAGGPVVNALEENICAVASQIIADFAHAHYNRDLERPHFFASNNISVSAALFHKVGRRRPGVLRRVADARAQFGLGARRAGVSFPFHGTQGLLATAPRLWQGCVSIPSGASCAGRWTSAFRRHRFPSRPYRLAVPAEARSVACSAVGFDSAIADCRGDRLPSSGSGDNRGKNRWKAASGPSFDHTLVLCP
jgi:glycosyltransferase involved in cell wall biosynthesis